MRTARRACDGDPSTRPGETTTEEEVWGLCRPRSCFLCATAKEVVASMDDSAAEEELVARRWMQTEETESGEDDVCSGAKAAAVLARRWGFGAWLLGGCWR